MEVLHTLVCFFFVSLLDGYTGFINAEIITGQVGGDVTHECYFTVGGRRRIFCRDECKEKDILVETTEDRAQRGRYSIEYKAKGFFSSKVLYVSITNLKKSDSGRYRCALDRPGFLDSYEEFDIRVEDAPTLRPLPATSASTPTTTQGLNSSSEGFPPPSASPEVNNQSEQQQTPAGPGPAPTIPSASTPTTTQMPAAGSGVVLPVRLTLFVGIIASSAAALIFCWKRASKAEEPPVETEYVDVTEANRVSEEIGEDRRSRSPPEETSTV